MLKQSTERKDLKLDLKEKRKKEKVVVVEGAAWEEVWAVDLVEKEELRWFLSTFEIPFSFQKEDSRNLLMISKAFYKQEV